MDGDNEEWTSSDKDKKDSKSNTWLQCDKCKYTTLYNSFMVHHIRKHGETSKKLPVPEKTHAESTSNDKTETSTKTLPDSTQLKDDSLQTLQSSMEVISTNKINRDTSNRTIASLQKDDSVSDESETVEMIAAEINEFTDERVMISNSTVEHTQDSQQETAREVESEGHEQVIQVAPGDDSIDGSNTICMVDENGMIVQKMEQAEDGTLYVQVMENPDATKQVLSVAEDGSVQMVEVMWDEMVNQEAVDDDNIPF